MPLHDINVNNVAIMTSPSGDRRAPGGTLNTLLSKRLCDTRHAYIAIAVGTNSNCSNTGVAGRLCERLALHQLLASMGIAAAMAL